MNQAHALTLSGPAGALEACLSLPPAPSERPVAILCHPHPQYGGSMHDGVVGTLENPLLEAGWATLRFNFRGVGASAGTFDQGIGEQADVRAVVAAVRSAAELDEFLSPGQRSQSPLLCGYSFGAAMAWQAQLSTPVAIHSLWLVAPPLTVMGLASGDPQSPVEVFTGSHDSYCAANDAQAWAAALPVHARVHQIDQADHFFAGQYQALAQAAALALAS